MHLSERNLIDRYRHRHRQPAPVSQSASQPQPILLPASFQHHLDRALCVCSNAEALVFKTETSHILFSYLWRVSHYTEALTHSQLARAAAITA